MYGTAQALRDRFRTGIDRDDFARLDDADLEQALTSASSEINSWVPGGAALTPEDITVLTDKALVLARMLAHHDSALSQEHPIVRDAMAVRTWLKALARGAVKLPSDRDTDATGAATIAAGTRSMRYTGNLWDTYPK
jgi:phage gp36-like protein